MAYLAVLHSIQTWCILKNIVTYLGMICSIYLLYQYLNHNAIYISILSKYLIGVYKHRQVNMKADRQRADNHTRQIDGSLPTPV